jgi:hypothetical protein
MPISVNKRLKETARQEKQHDKGVKRQQRREIKTTVPAAAPGEDPDLAGIIPGPQPVEE